MAEEKNKQNNDATTATGTSGIGNGENTSSNQSNSSSKNSGANASSSNQSNQESTDTQNAQGNNPADQIASTVGSVLRGDTGAATGTARGIVSQVKESGGKVASEALGQVKEKAATKIDEQKASLAQGLGNVADTIRQVGDNLRGTAGENNVTSTAATYGDSLANQVEQFSTYLEKHNVSDMLREVERFARRNPAYFIGGAFLLGVLGARFLKSSPNQALTKYDGGQPGAGNQEEVFHHHTEKNVEGSGEGIRFE